MKLKLTPRVKFWKFHLYRKPITGLTVENFEDFLDTHNFIFKNKPFGEHSLSWPEWKFRIKRICPIQYYIRQNLIYDIRRFLKVREIQDWYYYQKCKWFHPYNVIKCKHLPPTWVDEDTLLLHGMFAVLERFMEEQPAEHNDYELKFEADQGMTEEQWEKWAAPQRRFWAEINAIYVWWNAYQFHKKVWNDVLDGKIKKWKTREMISLMGMSGDIIDLTNTKDFLDKLQARLKEFKEQEEWAMQVLITNREGLWV